MSYILDALRRAEAERSRGAVPGLHTPVIAGAGAAPVAPLRAGPLGGGSAAAVGLALILAAAAVGGWWVTRGGGEAGNKQPARADAAQGDRGTAMPSPLPGLSAALSAASSAEPSVPPDAPVATGGASAANATSSKAPASASTQRVVPSPRDNAPPVAAPVGGSVGGTQRAKPSVAVPAAAKPSASERPQPPAALAARELAAPPTTPRAAQPLATKVPAVVVPSTGAVFAQVDLPEAVRAQLPTLKISGITYSSNPVARMAIVNGQVLHEGDAAAPGLLLERIEPARTVWAFQGYRVGLAP